MALVWLLVPALLMPRPDSVPRAQPDSGRWAASGELAYTNVEGNTALSLLTTGLELRRDRDRRYAVELSALARYGRSDGDVAVENYAAGTRLRFSPTGALSPYVAVNYTRDPVKNLRVRWAARAGIEANLLRGAADRSLAVGVALLRDYESRLLPADSEEPATVTRTRFNTSATAQVQVREGVTLDHRIVFEPATRDLSDYLIVSRTSLRVSLTRVVGLQTTFSFERDNTPPPGIRRKNDRTLSVGLLFSFK